MVFKWRTQSLNIDTYDFEYLKSGTLKGKFFEKLSQRQIIIIAPSF